MRKRQNAVLFWGLVIVLYLVQSKSSFCWMTPRNIIDLVNNAHTVCKGSVLDVTEEGDAEIVRQADNTALLAEGDAEIVRQADNTSLKKLVARFKVDRFYKGNSENEIIEIEFLKPLDKHLAMYALSLREGEYWLVFLNSSGNRFVFPNVFPNLRHGKMPISRALAPLPEGMLDPFERLELDLAASFKDEDWYTVFTAVEQFGNLKKVKSTEPLKELLSLTTDKQIEGMAYKSLISLGDYSMLERAVKFVESEESSGNVKAIQHFICLAIGQIKDASLLPQLYELTQAKNSSLREQAALAIHMMKSPKAVKYLINGLNNSDVKVRYHCIHGLAGIEKKGVGWNAFWGGGYEKNEQTYIDRWKDWWETIGKQKYSGK